MAGCLLAFVWALILASGISNVVPLSVSTCTLWSSKLFTQAELDGHFALFKNKFNRVYPSLAEEQHRLQVFARNLDFILQSNIEARNGFRSYQLAVNNFADLTHDEFRSRFRSNRKSFHNGRVAGPKVSKRVKDPPDQIDWVAAGVVTPVKDQGYGPGWPFSAVASLEGMQALYGNKSAVDLVPLSTQNLIDCLCTSYDADCDSVTVNDAFEYVQQNGGIDTELAYPISNSTVLNSTCLFTPDGIGANISGYQTVDSGDEKALLLSVLIGPISAYVDSSQPSFQFYSSGVYNEPNCDPNKLAHEVAVVGYGTLQGADYWKVKNSWGTEWGNEGYILMSRNQDNQCGIATAASYPIVIPSS